METFSVSLVLCEGNVTGGFPSQRPVTQSFDISFDLHLNKRLSKQSKRRWFGTPSYYDVTVMDTQRISLAEISQIYKCFLSAHALRHVIIIGHTCPVFNVLTSHILDVLLLTMLHYGNDNDGDKAIYRHWKGKWLLVFEFFRPTLECCGFWCFWYSVVVSGVFNTVVWCKTNDNMRIWILYQGWF